MTHEISAIKQGILGAATSFSGLGVSLIESVEQGLRITSLLIGITVGILTIISITRKLKGKK